MLLAPRREPYWSRVRAGLYVGYRRLQTGEGTWIARRRADSGNGQQYRALGDLAQVQDLRSQRFDEARRLAEVWAGAVDQGAKHRRTTVEAACRLYVAHQAAHKGRASAADAEGRFRRLVYSDAIGRRALDKLLPSHVEEWLREQLDDDGDEDDLRRSKDSANRNLAALKAALNYARQGLLVASDTGWATVSSFERVGRRRERFLGTADRTALLAKCDPDLADLVRALLLTAVRPGEIANANAGDFDKSQGTLALTGKVGTRVVTLSSAATIFFAAQARNKLPAAPLLTDAFGNRWGKDGWKKRFKEAARAAGLPGDVVLYTLRHTAISEMIAGGMDSFVVARLAGTSTTMIDKHYGHLRHDRTRSRLDQVALL